MANEITATALIARVRQRTETETSDFVSDAEIVNYLNDSMKSYFDFMLTAYEDYLMDGYVFTTVAGTQDYTLPDNFYKMRGLDAVVDSSTILTCTSIQFAERNRYRVGANVWNQTAPTKYYLSGNKISLYPTPASAYSCTLYYIPQPPLIVDGYSADFIGPWDTFVVLDTCIAIRDKEESDVSVLMKARDELKVSIIQNAKNRDASGPARIVDTRRRIWRL